MVKKKTSVVPISQSYVIKQMVNAIACTVELLSFSLESSSYMGIQFPPIAFLYLLYLFICVFVVVVFFFLYYSYICTVV